MLASVTVASMQEAATVMSAAPTLAPVGARGERLRAALITAPPGHGSRSAQPVELRPSARPRCPSTPTSTWARTSGSRDLVRLRTSVPFPVHIVSAGNIREDAIAGGSRLGE
jgi:hypothetical protein